MNSLLDARSTLNLTQRDLRAHREKRNDTKTGPRVHISRPPNRAKQPNEPRPHGSETGHIPNPCWTTEFLHREHEQKERIRKSRNRNGNKFVTKRARNCGTVLFVCYVSFLWNHLGLIETRFVIVFSTAEISVAVLRGYRFDAPKDFSSQRETEMSFLPFVWSGSSVPYPIRGHSSGLFLFASRCFLGVPWRLYERKSFRRSTLDFYHTWLLAFLVSFRAFLC